MAEETSGLSADGLTGIAVSLWVDKKGDGGTIPRQDKEMPHGACHRKSSKLLYTLQDNVEYAIITN